MSNLSGKFIAINLYIWLKIFLRLETERLAANFLTFARCFILIYFMTLPLVSSTWRGTTFPVPLLKAALPSSLVPDTTQQYFYNDFQQSISQEGCGVTQTVARRSPACCIAGPSSNLGSAPHRRPPTERKQWEDQ